VPKVTKRIKARAITSEARWMVDGSGFRWENGWETVEKKSMALSGTNFWEVITQHFFDL
jgi:hypothetical protein